MNPPPTWKKVLAFILDLFGTFFLFGFGIAAATGGLTDDGFKLNGGPAFLVLAMITAYFILMNKFLGGTLGKRIFGIAKK